MRAHRLIALVCALVVWKNAEASEPLDIGARLLEAEQSDVASAGRRDGRVWIRTSESSLKSVIALPLSRDFSPGEFDILDIRMKTNARVHAFSFHWLRTDQTGATESLVVERPTHRDDHFHRYMVRLDLHPGWAGSIQWVGIGWIGSDGSIEIERAELKPLTVIDWMTYQWLEVWTPESLSPLAVNVIPGPRIFDLPLAGVLALTCLASMVVVMLIRFPGLQRPLRTSVERPSRAVTSLGLVVLIGFWMIFDLRDVHSHLQTLDSERRHFFGKPAGERHFFELDDLPDFLDALDRRFPDGAPIAFFSGMPHEYHARYRLYPRRVIMRDADAPYIVVFQDPTITFRNGLLIERGMPLDGRFEPLWRFGPSAVVFQRLDG